MKSVYLIPSIILSLLGGRSAAQFSISTSASLNVNNIDATVLVRGDMWHDPGTGTAHCAVPNGSSKNIASAGAVWMSGYDPANTLHLSAQTYGQAGNDYWPGPLDGTGSISFATSVTWAKIWKVTREDIQIFQVMYAAGTATSANTAAAIWEWPAKGNVHARGDGGVVLTITDDMAPFVDINGDGVYQPDLGEYPDVPGDMNLWWVFSDYGQSHTQSNAFPLQVEVHALAFGFKRWNAIDNVAYFQYEVINKSGYDYHDFRIGQFADMDLGSPTDDYVGCDTNRGMGIVYNGTATDAVYGSNMPMAGIRMNVVGSGLGSFIYFNNDESATGNPSTPEQYDNYLRAKFRDGSHIKNDYTTAGVPTTGHGAGPMTNFVYSGNPSDAAQWSECSSANVPGDRRFLLSSGDIALHAGAKLSATVMLMTTDLRTNNACGSASFAALDSVADVAQAGFDNHYHNYPPIPLGVAHTQIKAAIDIYPNPAHDILYIENTAGKAGEQSIAIYNIMGQSVTAPITLSGKTTAIDISRLPAGLYNVVYTADAVTTAKFVKE